MDLTLVRGQQVMVDQNLSGPAAGRFGYITGNMRDGHYEVVDRPPQFSSSQVVGWFEPDQLHAQPHGKRGSRR